MKLTVLKNNSSLFSQTWSDEEIEEGFELFVGRSEDCHVYLDDPLISRHHFVIKFINGKWVVEKLSELGIISVSGRVLEDTIELNGFDSIVFPPYTVMLEGVTPQASTQQVSQTVAQTSYSSGQGSSSLDSLDLPTQSGMNDDLPAIEELEATEVLTNNFDPDLNMTPASQPKVSDHTQELAEGLYEETSSEESFDANEESFSDMDSPIGEEGHNDHSNPEPSEENVDSSGSFNSEEEAPVDPGFDSFSAESTQADLVPSENEGEDGATRVFKSFAKYELLLFGEYAPYDRYAIDKSEIYIGRDTKKCQIILNDPEVSSVHAVLKKSLVNITLEDLNSSNGTILNGERINKNELNNGDEFIIGSTTFTVQVVSDLLIAESDRLMPVEEGQSIETIEEIEEEVPLDGLEGGDGIDFNSVGNEPQEKSLIKRIMKDPKTRKKAIFAVVGLLLLSLLMEDDGKKVEAPKPDEKKVAEAPKPEEKVDANKRVFSPDEIRALEAKYKIAEAYVKDKKLDEALAELEQILAVDPEFANAKVLYNYVENENKKLKEEQERLKLEAAKAIIREEVKALVVEAKEAAASRNIPRAEQLFAKILEKDPENMDVAPLKEELDRWQAEERMKADEKSRKIAERKRMVDALSPGKKAYLAREWHKAGMKLREFTGLKGMDEDLLKEAGTMIADADAQLSSEVAPLLGKARSLKEGQDLKGAYETYLEVLNIDPTNKEGLDEVDAIRDLLEIRSKKVYREAIISESLSLFGDAKEKFQEVQQISPTDSDYYKKASDKLKNYLE